MPTAKVRSPSRPPPSWATKLRQRGRTSCPDLASRGILHVGAELHLCAERLRGARRRLVRRRRWPLLAPARHPCEERGRGRRGALEPVQSRDRGDGLWENHSASGGELHITSDAESEGYNLFGSLSGAPFPARGHRYRRCRPHAWRAGGARRPHPTIPLLPGSPAIDAIPFKACLTHLGPWAQRTDQRGEKRPAGEGCDIGAYELQ